MKSLMNSFALAAGLSLANVAAAQQAAAATEPAFTTEQQALVGAAFLGLTPDVIAASGLTDDQAAALSGAVSGVRAYEQLIAYAREVDRERQLASVPEPQCSTSLAAGHGPDASGDSASAVVSSSPSSFRPWVSALVSTFVIVDGLGGPSPLRAGPDTSEQRGGDRRGSKPRESTTSSRDVRDANAEFRGSEVGQSESERVDRLEVFRARLRGICLQAIPGDRAELVESCFQAKMDGIAPQYGVAARTPEQRAVLRDALRAELDSRVEGQPLELKHAEVLRAARRSPEFARAKKAVSATKVREGRPARAVRRSEETTR